MLIAPQHPVECLWHSLLRPYPAFEAPFNGHGTVFFLPSWSSLFQLRMTRNWSAPVCLPGSEESGSMRRSPIGFQERRQVGGTAIRFMRVDDCLLPRFFSRYLYKADTNTAKAEPSLSAGNQELGQDCEGLCGELGLARVSTQSLLVCHQTLLSKEPSFWTDLQWGRSWLPWT